MKKALVASLLGIALNVASSYGQGYIVMENYKVVGVTPVFSGVTYGAGSGAKTGQFVGAAQGWKADLLFSLDGGTTFNLAAGSQTAFFGTSNDGGTPTTDGAGSFLGGNITIPGYTSGTVKSSLKHSTARTTLLQQAKANRLCSQLIHCKPARWSLRMTFCN